MSALRLAALDALAWAAISAGFGYLGHRLPLRLLERDLPLTRLRPSELDGSLYRRLGVRRWKDRLPEAGALFAGGFSKRTLRSRDRAHLARFVAETRRAELVHWAILGAGPLFLLWNPAWLGACMLVYAAAANGPCILVQRFNRARLIRLLAR